MERAFCWAHVRRDFFVLGQGLARVGELGDELPWPGHRGPVRSEPASGCRSESITESFAFTGISNCGGRSGDWRGSAMRSWGAWPCTLPGQKVLRSLERHWEGLTVFLDQYEAGHLHNACRTRLERSGGGAQELHGSGSRVERPSGNTGGVHDPAAPYSWGRSTPRWLSAYLQQSCAESWHMAPPQAATRFLALGDGSSPQSGLESSARPGGGIQGRYCGRRHAARRSGNCAP